MRMNRVKLLSLSLSVGVAGILLSGCRTSQECGAAAVDPDWRTHYYTPADYDWCLQESVYATKPITYPKAVHYTTLAEASTPDPEITVEKLFGGKQADRIELLFMKEQNDTTFFRVEIDPVKTTVIKLPFLAPGSYWVDGKCWRAGKLLEYKKLVYWVLENNDPSLEQTPFTARSSSSLFFSSLPDTIKADAVTCKISIHNIYDKVLHTEEHPYADWQTRETPFSFDQTPGTTVIVNGELWAKDRLLDKRLYYQGRKGSTPAKPDWASISAPAASKPAFEVDENQPITFEFENGEQGFLKLIEDMKKRGSTAINLSVSLSMTETLTGCYDWTNLDKYVRLLSEHGIRFGFAYIGGTNFQRLSLDIQGEWQMDQKGRTNIWGGGKYKVISAAAKDYQKAAASLARELAERYHDHPLFTGYTFINHGHDSHVFNDHHFKVFTGYERAAREDFRQFLKKRYRNISALNRAWQSDFDSFDAVTPPLPRYELEANLTPAWKDLTAYRLGVYVDTTIGLFSPAVRSVDKKSQLYHYTTFTGPIEYTFPALRRYNAKSCDGGGEGENMRIPYSIMANHGITHRPESHHVPPEKLEDLQAMVINLMRHGIHENSLGMVWNSEIDRHADYYPTRKPLQEAMDWWTDAIRFLQGMKGAQAVPSGIGTIVSWEDLFARTRSWKWYSLNGHGLLDTLNNSGIGSIDWLTAGTDKALFDRQRVILVGNDVKVWNAKLVKRLAAYVKSGGHLVLCGDSGKYNWDSPNFSYSWRKAFAAPFERIEALPDGEIERVMLAGKELSYKQTNKALPAGESNQEGASHVTWSLGKGRIAWFGGDLFADSKSKTLPTLLSWAGLTPRFTTSNPEFQGFFLQKDGTEYLVVCNFMGLMENREVKEHKMCTGQVYLNSLEDGAVRLEPVFGKGAGEVKGTAKELAQTGFPITLRDGQFQVFRIVQ